MHPFQKPRTIRSTRGERRQNERQHQKALRRVGKTPAQAAADMSRLHAEGFALMWYACMCGHRERIWNSRDGVTPYVVPCPSCGASSLTHVNWHDDRTVPNYTPHDGQRVFVDMTRQQAEQIVARAFHRLNLPQTHPRFKPSIDELVWHTSGSSPLVAVSGDVAWYAPHTEGKEAAGRMPDGRTLDESPGALK